MPRYQRHIFVCTNFRPPENPTGCCAAKGGEQVRLAMKEEIKRRKLKPWVRACTSSCLANCSDGVTVVVYPEAVWYGKVTLQDVDEIMERHIIRGEIVERLLIPKLNDVPRKLAPLDPGSTAPDDASSDGSAG
jgi:(2Fe-2S) ferredoxin